MNKGKKLYISIAAALITVLYICFVILDFSRFSSLDFTYDVFPSGVLKRTSVLLASTIAWFAGHDMKSAFISACLGEAAFALNLRFFGLIMFFICQALLIIRNSRGICSALRHASVLHKKRLYAVSIFILFVYAGSITYVSRFIGFNAVTAAVYLYWSILNLSLLSAVACCTLRLLPERNAVMTCAGVFCFYCCDVLVGLDVVLEPGLPWLLANSFIWVFYIPALLLLALSSCKYE